MKKAVAIMAVFILIGVSSVIVDAKNSNSSAYLPPSFTWRDINGTDYTTPIKNQAPAPTCEAYALVAALETKMQYKAGKIYNPDLSEAHLYFYPGGTVRAGYVNIIDAANYLVEHGVPDEGCFPDPHRPYDSPFESLPGWENRTVKITEWGWVNHTQDAIKKALIEHGPLAVCVRFYKDFYYYTGGRGVGGFNFKRDAFAICSAYVQKWRPREEGMIIGHGGTYMHELGHQLGLPHLRVFPWQPLYWLSGNYKSCMNYRYNFKIVDYSDGTHGFMDRDEWGNLDLRAFER